MGIKYFFKWFKESFPKSITKPFGLDGQNLKNMLNKEENSKDNPVLLLLDLNGIIHTSCQKIYKYGTFEPKSLLKKSPPIYSGEKDTLVFEDVLNSINSLVTITNPQEIVLCIDGVAPISKQIQQRQRRFLSKKTSGGFDSNCISPGTDFLYRLGLYLKSNIESKLEKEWLNTTTIYFMDSLVPGEGEHKLYDFLRSNQSDIKEKKYNIIVVGNDADLIMLSLLVSTLFLKENSIYILREDLTSKKFDYLLVNIDQFKKCLLDFSMAKPNFKHYYFQNVVCDFVILCFMVGNDFLPSLPLFNIYDGGLDLIMKYYFNKPGYITFQPYSSKKNKKSNKVQLNFKNITEYFEYILNHINPQAIQHYKSREYGYPNILLDVAIQKKNNFIDISNHYLKSYSLHHTINKSLIQAYLEEINWVFNYYAYGGSTVDWTIYYPSQFAPTALDIFNHLSKSHNLEKPKVSLNQKNNIDPFFQLLCILPPHSCDLLPVPFNEILRKNLTNFHPLEIKIDYEGKLNEWEGIPLLPPLDHKEIFSIYNDNLHLCKKEDLKRNKTSKQLMISVV